MSLSLVSAYLHFFIPLMVVMFFVTARHDSFIGVMGGVVWGVLSGFAYYLFVTSPYVSAATTEGLFSSRDAVTVYGMSITPGLFYTAVTGMIGYTSATTRAGFGKPRGMTVFAAIVYVLVLGLLGLASIGDSSKVETARIMFDLMIGLGLMFGMAAVPTLFWTIVGSPNRA